MSVMTPDERAKTFRPGRGRLQTDLDDEVKAPWGHAYIIQAANGLEYHVAPTEEHVAEPTCWCNPLIDPKNENVWIHRKINKPTEPCPNCHRLHA